MSAKDWFVVGTSQTPLLERRVVMTIVIAPDDVRTGLCRSTVASVTQFEQLFPAHVGRLDVRAWFMWGKNRLIDMIHTPEQCAS